MKTKAKSLRTPSTEDAMHRWGLRMATGGSTDWMSASGMRTEMGGMANPGPTQNLSSMAGIPALKTGTDLTSTGPAAGVPATSAVQPDSNVSDRSARMLAAGDRAQKFAPMMSMPAGLALRNGGEYHMASGGDRTTDQRGGWGSGPRPTNLPPPAQRPVTPIAPQTPLPAWYRNNGLADSGVAPQRMRTGGEIEDRAWIRPGYTTVKNGVESVPNTLRSSLYDGDAGAGRGFVNPAPVRMADGGFLSSITPNFMKSSAQRYAEYEAAKAAPAPAPVASAPQTAAPLVRGVLDPKNALQTREQAAGLADGGMVPGQGEGDKVPALYEPGEFVVSNAMLKKAPGLREQLHELREETLEGQGKTVAEADAKQVKGGRLRAEMGAGDWAKITKDQLAAGQRGVQAMEEGVAPRGVGGQKGQLQAIAEQRNLMHQPPGELARYPSPVDAEIERASKSSPAAAAAPPTAAAPAAPDTRGVLRRGVENAWDATKGVRNFVRGAAPVVAAGAAGAAAANFARDIGNPDREPDGNAQPNPLAAQIPTGGVPGAGPTAKVQPYNAFTDTEVGRNVGNTVNALSMIPTSGAASNALRLAGAPRAAAALPLAAAAVQGAGAQIRSDRADTTTPPPSKTVAPPRPVDTSGPMGPEEPPNAIRVTRQANGNLSFSGNNIGQSTGGMTPGDKGNTYIGSGSSGLRSNPIGIMPAMDPALIKSTLTNPDGSGWTATDNARMAANLRDGNDPYRGTSRQAGEDATRKQADLEALAASPLGTPGRTNAMAQLTNKRNNDTLRRGQDIQMEGHRLNYEAAMMPARLAQAQAKQMQTVLQQSEQSGEDPVKLAVKLGAHPSTITALQGYQKEQEGLLNGRAEQVRGAFKNLFTLPDKDGQPVRDEQAEAIAAEQFTRLAGNKTLTPEQRVAHFSDAVNYAKAIAAARVKEGQANEGWQRKWAPWGSQQPLPTSLPQNMSPESVGAWEGATTGHNLERGDLRYGPNFVLPGNIDEGTKNYLRKIGDQQKKLRE